MNETVYFDTQERAERLQLLTHLINNTRDILYLRGPHGAGKTRFGAQLADAIESDYAVIWLTAGAGVPLSDQLPSDQQAGVVDDADLDLIVQAEPERPLLLIIDDADALRPEELLELEHRSPPGSRILLLGTGGGVQGLAGREIQFVDLPAFTEEQTAAFIRMQGEPGSVAAGDGFVQSLHRAARGQPGPLLDALTALPATGREPPLKPVWISWPWALLVVVLASLLISVLLFQDRINAWFQPSATDDQVTVKQDRAQALVAAQDKPTEIERQRMPQQTLPELEAAGAVPPLAEPMPGPVVEPLVEPAPAGADVTPPAVAETMPEESPDPILDAVIDAAIDAAAQPPRTPESPSVVAPAEQPPASSGANQLLNKQAAPVIAKQQLPAQPKSQPEPVAGAGTPATGNRPAVGGLNWLLAQPPSHYTLQLVGGRDRASVDKFIRQHRITGPHAVFVRDLNGRPWYSLVSGSYPDREAALAGLAKLPRDLSGAWPRTFASIQQLIRSSGTPAANQ